MLSFVKALVLRPSSYGKVKLFNFKERLVALFIDCVEYFPHRLPWKRVASSKSSTYGIKQDPPGQVYIL